MRQMRKRRYRIESSGFLMQDDQSLTIGYQIRIFEGMHGLHNAADGEKMFSSSLEDLFNQLFPLGKTIEGLQFIKHKMPWCRTRKAAGPDEMGNQVEHERSQFFPQIFDIQYHQRPLEGDIGLA